MSQSYSLLELRRYSAAESSRKGVVGSTGRNMPTTPSASDRLPKKAKRYFIQSSDGYSGREDTQNIAKKGIKWAVRNKKEAKKLFFIIFFVYFAIIIFNFYDSEKDHVIIRVGFIRHHRCKCATRK